jgi:hypothetical protein
VNLSLTIEGCGKSVFMFCIRLNSLTFPSVSFDFRNGYDLPVVVLSELLADAGDSLHSRLL